NGLIRQEFSLVLAHGGPIGAGRVRFSLSRPHNPQKCRSSNRFRRHFSRERKDIGRAITSEDERRLLDAIKRSRSAALLPLFVLSIDSGLRASEVRALRCADLDLKWKDQVIDSGILTVPTSKTDAGAGRTVPLTKRTCAVLTLWLSRFPEADSASYVFPRHAVGFAGNKRIASVHDVDLSHPTGQWKKAWKIACKSAKVSYRWHDCRHTFITRLCGES
ncbi:MAG: site-specific integrase, partial [Acidobacteriota bacterium]|nr:site-specific integrase [Acidobacteriota bacterium]